MYVCMYVLMRTMPPSSRARLCIFERYTEYLCVCTYVCMYVYFGKYDAPVLESEALYIRKVHEVSLCVYTYACMYVCMYTARRALLMCFTEESIAAAR
jgi:hypothetical protein